MHMIPTFEFSAGITSEYSSFGGIALREGTFRWADIAAERLGNPKTLAERVRGATNITPEVGRELGEDFGGAIPSMQEQYHGETLMMGVYFIRRKAHSWTDTLNSEIRFPRRMPWGSEWYWGPKNEPRPGQLPGPDYEISNDPAWYSAINERWKRDPEYSGAFPNFHEAINENGRVFGTNRLKISETYPFRVNWVVLLALGSSVLDRMIGDGLFDFIPDPKLEENEALGLIGDSMEKAKDKFGDVVTIPYPG